MNTLLLCPELFARESGIQRVMRLYLKALCESTEDPGRVDLVVLNDRELPAGRLAAYSNDRLRYRLACDKRKGHFLWAAVHGASDIDRLICGHLGQLVAAWMGRALNPTLDYYLVAHGIEVWKPYTALERMALRRARRILCVSEFTRREMQRQIELPDWKFAIVPNALDPFFEQAGPPSPDAGAVAAPVVLTVARLDAAERYKGVDHLIQSFPAVVRAIPGSQLRIVGAGNDVPRLVALAQSRGVAEAVKFDGALDDEHVRQAYRDCALFALPSRAEGFGIVFLEAMASGKPCLGARAGATPEVIDDASGVLVDYGDIDQLAAQLVRALRREWNSEQIRARADQFSYPVFKECLNRAMESKPSCRPLRSDA